MKGTVPIYRSSLNSCGFSSSYSEVKKYELNAAITQKTDIPEALTSSHLQYIAENVDHNIRTIDGHGTFHGMGIVASLTPLDLPGKGSL
jgi:hypothetical protein